VQANVSRGEPFKKFMLQNLVRNSQVRNRVRGKEQLNVEDLVLQQYETQTPLLKLSLQVHSQFKARPQPDQFRYLVAKFFRVYGALIFRLGLVVAYLGWIQPVFSPAKALAALAMAV
jgi:hypothetical protein